MANQIPLSGAATAGGELLPIRVLETLVEKVRRESGTLFLADVRQTTSRQNRIPVYRGRPQAQFVDEGAAKPVDGAEFRSLDINIKKIAVILEFTEELLEDVQSDPMAYITPDVTAAFADLIDAHLLGVQAGTVITSQFDDDLNSSLTTNAAVELGTAQDALRTAISAAMGEIEANGYKPNGVVLSSAFHQAIRDARTALDATKELYTSEQDPAYGLKVAFSSNLHNLTAAAGSVVAVVGDFSMLKVMIRKDMQVTSDDKATVNGKSAFEYNLVYVRFEMRLGAAIGDERAFCKIVNAA